MITSNNISRLLFSILILYIALFIYETFWITPIPNIRVEPPLEITKVLLKDILDDILSDSEKRTEILNLLYTYHPNLSQHIPSCRSSTVMINYISSFIDLDPFARRAGIILTTNMISYKNTMINCLLYSNREITNILIELLLQKQLDKALLDLLVQCAKSLAIIDPTKTHYYEILLHFRK